MPTHTDSKRVDWRSPLSVSTEPASRATGLRTGLSGYLNRVFEDSEDENKEVILRCVAELPAREVVLDVGCYNGAFTVDLGRAARARELHGVEWLDEWAEVARDRGVHVAQADVNDGLPYADGSFDLVHANQVIEHLRGTDQFLREMARVCAPGGKVVLSTNNLASWHNVASLVLGYQPFPSHVSDEVHVGNPFDPRRYRRHADAGQTHLRVFTVRALAELAEIHGLRLDGLHMNGYYPLPPRAARHAVRVDPRHAAYQVLVFSLASG